MKSKVLLIWDSEDEAPTNYNTIIVWNSFKNSPESNIISAFDLVEEKSDLLRREFLRWVYDFGETVVNGKRIIDILEISSNLSFWWFTSIGQKFNISGESLINDGIKALAVEPLIFKNSINEIRVVTDNTRLLNLFKGFSKTKDLKFSYKRLSKSRFISTTISSFLPNSFHAALYFFWYLKENVSNLISPSTEPEKFQGDVMFMDVLVHLDKKSFVSNKFLSNYWTNLIDLLGQLNLNSNWLHNFYRHKAFPRLANAEELMRKFNDSKLGQYHSLFESFLTFSIFINASILYFKLFLISIRLSYSNLKCKPINSSFNLFELFRGEFFESLKGKNAIRNCIRISLMEAVFKKIPYQKQGFYIQENQPWELALIHFWKMNGHGKLTGVPHSTVRFWDLRYFYDPKTYVNKKKNGLPIPDFIALNGPVVMDTYLNGGYPKAQLVKVEALRFMHLNKTIKSKQLNTTAEKQLTVLVCGDFLKETTNRMIRCLEVALNLMCDTVSVIIKPHPATLLKYTDYPDLSFEISEAALSELFLKCDVVLTSNITSAAVDAYCSGVPLIQFKEGSSFNLSPLRNIEGVKIVIDSTELLFSLKNIKANSIERKPYFFLNEDLRYWRCLLK